MRDITADVMNLIYPLPGDCDGSADDDRDPLLTGIAAARHAMVAAEARMRLLIAYGREFVRPRPYRLEDLAQAAGMSVSGVRTAYGEDEVAKVARLTGAGFAPVSNSDIDLIVDRITSDVAPNGLETPPGYAHLSLALIDAVYSIRSHYSAVKRVVAAYCAETGTSCDPLSAWGGPGFSERGLDDLLREAGALRGPELAGRLFAGSRSRSAGHLKADLCIEAASRLQAVSVIRIEDLRQRAGDADVRRAWTGVHGLGWVTWQYFCSLVGIDHFKPDVMLMRFVSQTLNRNIGPAEADAMLSTAFERLLPSHPRLTKRGMDHAIWLFQRDQSGDGEAATTARQC